MQARAEQHDLGRKHRQVALLALSKPVLGVCAAGIADDADDVAAADVLVLLLKGRATFLDHLRLADYLQLRADTDRVGSRADVYSESRLCRQSSWPGKLEGKGIGTKQLVYRKRSAWSLESACYRCAPRSGFPCPPLSRRT